MSKQIIMDACSLAQDEEYIWDLYYFRVNRQRNNPFLTYKVKFKNDSYISGYAKNLLNSIKFFQLKEINDVQDYNGENTKISCDKISLENELIKDSWEQFFSSITNPCEEKFKGNVQGYLLTGKPTKENGKSITFFKVGNPIIKLSDKKAHFYHCINDELDLVTDEFCRLYFTADFIIFNNNLYTFNLKFEKVFNLEKTMQKLKETSIEKISATQSIANVELFKGFAKEYKSAKSFVTLKQERIEKVKDKAKRSEIAKMLNLGLDDDENFIIDTAEKASLFIRYLCYKIFEDYETRDIIEVSNASKLNIN